MSSRATAFWVLLCAALVAAYWATDRRENTVRRAAEEAKRIFDYAPDAITTLSLKWFDEERAIEAVRTGAGWSLAAPFEQIPADQAAWDAVAAAAASLTNERTIDVAPDDLAAYGLDNPRLILTVGAESGTLRQVAVGGPDPTKTYLYIRVGDGDVMLGGAEPILKLNRRLDDLRDRRVLNFESGALSKIVYTGRTREAPIEKFSLALERTADGPWRMVAPWKAELNQRRVLAFASELAQARGRGYIDAPGELSDYGLAPPFATIEATADGRTKTLLVGWVAADDGGEQGGVYAKLQGTPSVFVMDAHLLTLIPGDAHAFRERRLFTRRAEALQRMHYESESAAFTLENDSYAGWKFVDPAYAGINQIAVSNYVGVLRRIEAQDFVEPGDAAEMNVRARVAFSFSDNTAPAAIELGDVVPGSDPPTFYARQDNGTVVVISFESAMALRAKAIEFRNRKLLEFRPQNVRVVDLELEGREFRFERNEQTWIVAAPAGHVLESAADVTALLEMLSALEAVEIDDLPPSPRSQGMDNPLLSVALTIVADTDAPVAIGPLRVANLVGGESSRVRFAAVAGKDIVYHVEQSLIDDMRAVLSGVVPRP